ncbi:PASTA domain-containing protein [Micromonospora sp. NBC_01699]|uniref:PASTA domain-containing protein n=1 Tax=Micromonospora sp. NBC_01699 TaxID=2975984 RepID=UPI002E2CB208|nr:PASTA domain-containing protein [Micromonospora sp. NBC_01699]
MSQESVGQPEQGGESDRVTAPDAEPAPADPASAPDAVDRQPASDETMLLPGTPTAPPADETVALPPSPAPASDETVALPRPSAAPAADETQVLPDRSSGPGIDETQALPPSPAPTGGDRTVALPAPSTGASVDQTVALPPSAGPASDETMALPRSSGGSGGDETMPLPGRSSGSESDQTMPIPRPPTGPAGDVTAKLPRRTSDGLNRTATFPAVGDGGQPPGGAWSGRAGVPPPAPPVVRGPAPAEWSGDDGHPRRWWLPILVGLIALVLLGVLVFGVWLIVQGNPGDNGPAPVRPSPSPTATAAPTSAAPTTPAATPTESAAAIVSVPPVIGLSQEDAQALLDQAGLPFQVQFRESDRPAGTVIASDPRPSTPIAVGSQVTLTIAEPPAPTATPTPAPTTGPPVTPDPTPTG